jgi:hypothetical protein
VKGRGHWVSCEVILLAGIEVQVEFEWKQSEQTRTKGNGVDLCELEKPCHDCETGSLQSGEDRGFEQPWFDSETDIV